MLISDLHNKKILVLGIGEEGKDNLSFLKKNISYKKIGVADASSLEDFSEEIQEILKKEEVNLHLGKEYLSAVKEYEIIIKTPGIPLHKIKKEKEQVITSQSDIFLSNCNAKVIGITGTKGKSTTCSFLHKVLISAGFSSFLVGNIGNPVLSFLGKEKPEDVFIYELSSFQLQTISKAPHISIFLNIFKDHLDKHSNFYEYISSKKKITSLQKKKDFIIYNEDDKIVKKVISSSLAQKVPFSEKKEEDFPRFVLPVLKVGEIMGISSKKIKENISSFKGLEHRLEYVGEHGAVHFYNDSAATIPEATIRALDFLPNTETLIIGGTDKGADSSLVVKAIKEKKVKNVILFKESPWKLKEELKANKINFLESSSMKEAVFWSKKNTSAGKICLLSPGFASFNMFKNYKERGDLFKKYVRVLI